MIVLAALLIVLVVSGEVSFHVTGMPYPEISTETVQIVTNAVDDAPGASVMDLVEQIAEGGNPLENIAPAQEGLPAEKTSINQESIPIKTALLAQEVLPAEKTSSNPEAMPVAMAPIAQEVLPTEKTSSNLESVPMETAPIAQEVLPTEKTSSNLESVPMETAPIAQEVLPTEKTSSNQDSVPLETAPIAQEVLPTENVPIVPSEAQPVANNFPVAQSELSLEKAPSGQTFEEAPMLNTVEEAPKVNTVESVEKAAPSMETDAPADPSADRLAKMLSFKSLDNSPAKVAKLMESAANVPSTEGSTEKAPAFTAVGPMDLFPVYQNKEPLDTVPNIPDLEAQIQDLAPAELPSIEASRDQPWDSVEDAREAASQLAYQQFLGIDPLAFAMNEMNSFDEEGENDRHYVKKRILQLSSEERAINQAYSENIEQREAERFRRKSLAIKRQPQI